MPTFNEGDIIRKITTEGDGEIVRVLENAGIDYMGLHIAIGNDDDDTWVDAEDYELVTDDQYVQESKTMEVNAPSQTEIQVHESITLMFVQAAQFATNQLDGETIQLEISGDYSSGDSMDVAFRARIGYGDWVESGNMFKSIQVAVQRHSEDEGLKAISIPMFREAAE